MSLTHIETKNTEEDIDIESQPQKDGKRETDRETARERLTERQRERE